MSGLVEKSPLKGTQEEEGEQPLSEGQRALWFLDRLDPSAAALHLAGAARVLGGLDVEALRGALVRLTERHPALRTTFEARLGAMLAPALRRLLRLLPESRARERTPPCVQLLLEASDVLGDVIAPLGPCAVRIRGAGYRRHRGGRAVPLLSRRLTSRA